MHADVLYDLARLFEDERELYVVAALRLGGALRFSELAYAVSQCARVKVPDSTIARVLRRLCGRGFVTATSAAGRGVYRLTEQGQRRAALIEALTGVLADRQAAAGQPGVPAEGASGGGLAWEPA